MAGTCGNCSNSIECNCFLKLKLMEDNKPEEIIHNRVVYSSDLEKEKEIRIRTLNEVIEKGAILISLIEQYKSFDCPSDVSEGLRNQIVGIELFLKELTKLKEQNG